MSNEPAPTKEELAERVYSTAVAFKEADEDPKSSTFEKASRWADYMKALRAHATHFVHEYINTMKRGTNV